MVAYIQQKTPQASPAGLCPKMEKPAQANCPEPINNVTNSGRNLYYVLEWQLSCHFHHLRWRKDTNDAVWHH